MCNSVITLTCNFNTIVLFSVLHLEESILLINVAAKFWVFVQQFKQPCHHARFAVNDSVMEAPT